MILDAPPAEYRVCDLDRIYNEDYQYSLPRSVIETFFSGNAFDYKKLYSQEDLSKVEADIQSIWDKIIRRNPDQTSRAVITAGAPGAGKTIKLKQDMEGKNCAYIDPDDVCLKSQEITYLADITEGNGSQASRKEAYDKWRPASNAATHIVLGNLIRDKYAFYFGTTSSSPMTYKFFEFLKAQGYDIKLIHVVAPDSIRVESIKERDKIFIQTTEQDIIEKGGLVPQRITDTFFKYADEIDFYYRDEVHEDAVLAATWKNKHITVIDEGAYEKMKAVHNLVAERLEREDLFWDTAVNLAKML